MIDFSKESNIEALKDISIAEIEEKFSDVLKELTGKQFEININKLDINVNGSKAKIVMNVNDSEPF